MDTLNELTSAVQTYFDALYECDIDKLALVFHPESSLFDADTGEVFVEPIASYKNDVSTRVSAKSVGLPLEAAILLIDYLSPISAVVKVRIRIHDNVFLDHLSFVKGTIGWQIVSKIWHLEKVMDHQVYEAQL